MEVDTAIIVGLGVLLSLGAVAPFLWKRRRLEHRTREADLYAQQFGLKEPATMHPVVNPHVCIGTGACLDVCPEKDVLGLRHGQAITVAPARCVGHGLCERACPVEAIQLVFGTEKRGVDIPRIKSNFETNVDGIYIVGELGGMGLIRNAFEQGRQCVEGIVRERRRAPAGALDLLVIGCGPAGLSVSLNALHHKLRFVAVEKEGDIGGTIRRYPRKKLVMSAPFRVPGYGAVRVREILKEGLVELWAEMVEKTGLSVRLNETVLAVHAADEDCFSVETTKERYTTRRVVFAIGRGGVPRKLDVPGEELGKVAYSLREPDQFRGDKILIVGGGDAAIEAALALSAQPGNQVKISYRQAHFSRIKAANLERIAAAVASGAIEVFWETNVTRIEPSTVTLVDEAGSTLEIENDYVFVFIGGTLPKAFLQSCGIAIDTKFGTPA